MEDFNWTCPHCQRAVTISYGRFSEDLHTLSMRNAEGRFTLRSCFVVCPNPDCQRFALSVSLYKSEQLPTGCSDRLLQKTQTWDLIPSSKAKSFPSYIPQTILDDYREASLIQDLSPKASATLSRRCLQGILRDFWQVKAGRLVDEIDQIRDRVDPLTWQAIDAVRTLGNIGAHMEKDINTVVDVDPNEAQHMIHLIEILLHDWYVVREERKARMSALVVAATLKET